MITNLGGIERENPFAPQESVDLSPDLIVWNDIRRAYSRFPTTESIVRVSALQQVVTDLEKEGLIADILVAGSLSLGQSVNNSDIDVTGIVTREKVSWDWKEPSPIIKLTEKFQVELSRRLGRDIVFSAKEAILFNADDLMLYLNNGYIADLSIANDLERISKVSLMLRYFYERHNISLGIGTLRMGLVDKIEELESENPAVKKHLKTVFSLGFFQKGFGASFSKYMERIAGHQEFLDLSEQERMQYIEYLEERQRQFLFYLENPFFCA